MPFKSASDRIRTSDGFEISRHVYTPSGEISRTLVVLPATAVPQQYYHHFAEYLASGGVRVITFDYRGIAESMPKQGLRSMRSRMRDWALKDAQAIVDRAHLEFSDVPISVIGHSFGGQSLGMITGNHRWHSVALVGAQSGYWRHFRKLDRYPLLFFWTVALPMISQAFGYFPSSMLGLGEDLPKEVALEWARWNREPEYFMGEFGKSLTNGFNAIRSRIRVYSVSDDRYAPERAVEALVKYLPKASEKGEPLEWVHLTPEQLEVDRVGHFGFFRDTHRDLLWAGYRAWLLGPPRV